MSEDVASPPSRPAPTSRRRTVVAAALVVLVVGAIVVLGRPTGAWVARQVAVGRIEACRFGAAERCLAWSRWLDPGDYQSVLLQAACRRRVGASAAWRQALETAQNQGAPEHRVRLELRLAAIQSGQLDERSGPEMSELAEAGAPLRDIMTAFLQGYLAQRNTGMARLFIERMPDYFADEAHAEYLRGVYWRRIGDSAQAEIHLTAALAAEPDHELARAELAALFEENGRLDRSLREFVELQIRSRRSEIAALGLARVLRKMGRLAEAKSQLAPLLDQGLSEPAVEVEAAQIELAEGHYERAAHRLRQAGSAEAVDPTVLMARATALALLGDQAQAQPLFAAAADLEDRSGWILDLRFRLASNPGDSATTEELRRISQAPPAKAVVARGSRHRGAELYALHCQVCHGASGDGRGHAARNVFPRPRDLRSGKMLLASTRNGVPTPDDVEKVLARGMPGTAMPAFEKLPDSDRKILAQEVLRLQRDGVRERLARSLREEDEAIPEAEIRQAVELCTTPGEPVTAPSVWPAAGHNAARGRQLYLSLGCGKCHGDDGTGSPDEPLFDDQGEPARGRDLVHEPFKGGRDPESIYVRIAAGMPGTPHPAALNVPQSQVVELVEYVRALAQEPVIATTNHERRERATAGAYSAWLRGVFRAEH